MKGTTLHNDLYKYNLYDVYMMESIEQAFVNVTHTRRTKCTYMKAEVKLLFCYITILCVVKLYYLLFCVFLVCVHTQTQAHIRSCDWFYGVVIAGFYSVSGNIWWCICQLLCMAIVFMYYLYGSSACICIYCVCLD
jgi:hypothetical protein